MTKSERANILIVDDVSENLRVLSAILKEHGFWVRSAISGKLAIRSAISLPPDLILLDIKMPQIDGLQVCSRLKAEESLKDIPIIFISAIQETDSKAKAFDAGGVDYVTKPFEAKEILARIRAHLELRRRRSELEKCLSDLKTLERLRDDLIHMMVHDMRSPLMTVDGYLNMLELFELEALSDDGKKYVRQGRKSIESLVRMTTAILSVNKLESGAVKLDLSPCDLAILTQQVISGANVVNDNKKICLIVSEPQCLVAVDQWLIERVLQNLVDNALKFSPRDDTITISISCCGDHVYFKISDNGPGIPTEHQNRIFEKFYQIGEGRKAGLGLGLTFCKLAISAHDGEIGVESKPGAGSTFWFKLRCRTAEG